MAQLTKEIVYKALQDFFQNKPLVVFGTGTSCAVDTHFGMESLKNYLLSEIPKQVLTVEQQKEWKSVIKKLASNADFESAMNAVSDETLVEIIVKSTGKFVSDLDNKHAIDISTGKTFWPVISILEKIVNGLPPTDRRLHVATPNYDLLAEYAFEHAGIPYTTGFVGGICRRLDWDQAERSMKYEERLLSTKSKTCLKDKKHIRFYKVHGSLNTFTSGNTLVENNAWIYNVPEGVERIMITPGTTKYEKLHENRYDLLAQFDNAVANHDAFLFLGFGFNDNQLCNREIRRKLIDQKCQGLIITRDTNDRIDRLLQEANNLWLVCKQEGNEGTRIYNKNYPDWFCLDDINLWDFAVFTEHILGG